ncbi:transposase [Mycobacterium servetii]|uniref:Transposase n=1 Tax=Mycobacterium servetii TaxID=3237418 RepID=A0ABV4C4I4_9MYCO
MSEKRKKYDREFREGAVRIVRETGKSIAQVARDLGIHEGTLGNWSRPETGVNGAGRRFCFETYQVIEERTYARACTSIADRPCSRQDRRVVRLRS